ncbi:MAG: CsgG/HfaB family protein [Treponema sp.]|nr:CsgG/HfaB family protein [Treponema sp.]
MKRNRVFSIMLLIGILSSCVSLEDKNLTVQERAETNIIGSVTATFTSFQFFNIPNKTNIKNKAYAELKKIAQREYGGNIDIRNITIAGGFALPELLNIGVGISLGILGFYDAFEGSHSLSDILIGAAPIPFIIGNFQKLTVTGDVVQFNAVSGSNQMLVNNVQNSMMAISDELIKTLPKGATIAVLSMSSNDRTLSETALDELEYSLVDSKQFIIVDRAKLDQIRNEQNLQAAGDISDDSAVSMGNIYGWNIVILGSISSTGSRGRITVKALDVKTAQIVTMAREQF